MNHATLSSATMHVITRLVATLSLVVRASTILHRRQLRNSSVRKGDVCS
jgi:hypothetical protein